MKIALPQATHHADDASDRLRQLLAQTPRARPHPGEKQHVEQHQAGNQQITDLQIALGQAVGLAEDALFIHHQQQAPTGLRDLTPGHQLTAAAQHQLLYIAPPFGHGFQ